jgi:hypothetical protein
MSNLTKGRITKRRITECGKLQKVRTITKRRKLQKVENLNIEHYQR